MEEGGQNLSLLTSCMATFRGGAVLIRHVTTWGLERRGLESLTAFHDLTNPFGSVKSEAMYWAVAS